MRLLPEMETALAGFDMAALEVDPQSAYCLTRELTIGYFNPGWFCFAQENSGAEACLRWGLGSSFLAGMTSVMRPSYDALFRTAALTLLPTQQIYLCPTPTRHRQYITRVLPLPSGVFVCHNTLVVERDHEDRGRPLGADYVSPLDLVLQCSNCRRVKHLKVENRWDWIPSLLEIPHEHTSHGLCEPCLAFFYPASAEP